MNKKQLIELLEPFPDDIEIWIDDGGYSEGGRRLESIEEVFAYEADLDGDEIFDEYILDEDLSEQQKELIKNGKYFNLGKHKYFKEDIYSTKILLIKGL